MLQRLFYPFPLYTLPSIKNMISHAGEYFMKNLTVHFTYFLLNCSLYTYIYSVVFLFFVYEAIITFIIDSRWNIIMTNHTIMFHVQSIIKVGKTESFKLLSIRSKWLPKLRNPPGEWQIFVWKCLLTISKDYYQRSTSNMNRLLPPSETSDSLFVLELEKYVNANDYPLYSMCLYSFLFSFGGHNSARYLTFFSIL